MINRTCLACKMDKIKKDFELYNNPSTTIVRKSLNPQWTYSTVAAVAFYKQYCYKRFGWQYDQPTTRSRDRLPLNLHLSTQPSVPILVKPCFKHYDCLTMNLDSLTEHVLLLSTGIYGIIIFKKRITEAGILMQGQISNHYTWNRQSSRLLPVLEKVKRVCLIH